MFKLDAYHSSASLLDSTPLLVSEAFHAQMEILHLAERLSTTSQNLFQAVMQLDLEKNRQMTFVCTKKEKEANALTFFPHKFAAFN